LQLTFYPIICFKNIAENDQLLNLNSFKKIPISDEVSRLRKSGAFEISSYHIIVFDVKKSIESVYDIKN